MRSTIFLLILGAFSSSTFSQSLDSGIELFQNGNLDEAETFFQDYISENENNSEAYFYLGRIAFDTQDFDESVKWFEEAVDLKEGDSKYHMWLGHGFCNRAQNAPTLKLPRLAKQCRNNYEKAIEIAPDNVEARESIMQYYLQAPGFVGGGRDKAENEANIINGIDADAGIMAWGEIFSYYDEDERTVSHFETAMETHPSSMAPYYGLYNHYFNNNEYESAAEIAERQLALNDTTPAVHHNFGNALARSDQFEKALEHYLITMELDSTFQGTWYQIGRLSAISGENLELGLTYINKYLALEDQLGDYIRSWAYFRLGAIQEHMNEPEEAKTSYRAAIEINGDHDEAKAALSSLN